jgi:hypothetical protein
MAISVKEFSDEDAQQLRKSKKRMMRTYNQFCLHVMIGVIFWAAFFAAERIPESWQCRPQVLWVAQLAATSFSVVSAFWGLVLLFRAFGTATSFRGLLEGSFYSWLMFTGLGLFVIPPLIAVEIERVLQPPEDSSGGGEGG